jgi:myo-inositol-1(or 4)-monophosphatase
VDNLGINVDKKIFLDKFMHDLTPDIHRLHQENIKPEILIKADHSAVTSLDLALTDFIEERFLDEFPEVTFYSEEKYSTWDFPMLSLDPLDGTKEFIMGRPEWSVSVGYFPQDSWAGEGWIYNPMTREEFGHPEVRIHQPKVKYIGEVSHSEWEAGKYPRPAVGALEVRPVGSIAYKLGRLSAGKSDFVVSLNPKNIWDIAAGTLLCQQAGMKFYSEGHEVKSVKKLYLPPLIWCHEELFSELSHAFGQNHKYP